MTATDASLPLKYLRSRRTRASNTVRWLITHNITSEAQFLGRDGLPSWWPFYSDCLYNAVRVVCREARTLAEAEQRVPS